MSLLLTKGFGPGTGPGGLIMQGLTCVIEWIREKIEGLLHRPEKFIFTIEIRGSVLRPFSKIYMMLGTVIGKWIKEFIVKGNLIEDYQSEDIIVAGDLVRPIAKSYNIKGKRGIMHIINWLLEDEDDD